MACRELEPWHSSRRRRHATIHGWSSTTTSGRAAGGAAGVEYGAGEVASLGQGRDHATNEQPRGRVQHHDVAVRTRLAVKYSTGVAGVGARIAAPHCFGRRGHQPELRRFDGERRRAFAVEREDTRRPRECEFVEPAVTVHDHRREGAVRDEHAQHPIHQRGIPHPTTCRRTRAGLARGPRTLNAVGTPSSLRVGPAWRNAG